MLTRLIMTADLVGVAGRTTPSLAQILGVSDVNNRRDHLCSAMLLHDGRMVQVVEGQKADLDRLVRRMRQDLRMKDLRVLSETLIAQRTLTEPSAYCPTPVETLARAGLADLELLTVRDVEAMLEHREAS